MRMSTKLFDRLFEAIHTLQQFFLITKICACSHCYCSDWNCSFFNSTGALLIVNTRGQYTPEYQSTETGRGITEVSKVMKFWLQFSAVALHQLHIFRASSALREALNQPIIIVFLFDPRQRDQRRDLKQELILRHSCRLYIGCTNACDIWSSLTKW